MAPNARVTYCIRRVAKFDCEWSCCSLLYSHHYLDTEITPSAASKPDFFAPDETWRQQQVKNYSDSVFVLCGDANGISPVGTAFTISDTMLLTAAHNVVQKTESEERVLTGLKVARSLVKGKNGKVKSEGAAIPVTIEGYHYGHDWACLKRQDGESFSTHIPVAMTEGELPKDATLEKLYIYHCPVELFLADDVTVRLHPMVKEAGVGIVNPLSICFQNGGFPGSCGGPYIFRNKAIAMHVASINTGLTAEMLEQLDGEEGAATPAKKKRKTASVLASEAMKVAESSVSSDSSLGSGIILQKRSGIMRFVKGEAAAGP